MCMLEGSSGNKIFVNKFYQHPSIKCPAKMKHFEEINLHTYRQLCLATHLFIFSWEMNGAGRETKVLLLKKLRSEFSVYDVLGQQAFLCCFIHVILPKFFCEFSWREQELCIETFTEVRMRVEAHHVSNFGN